MKVKLLSSTSDAMNLLLFTKQTRLNMSPGLYEEISKWPEEKKMEELEYISNTIPSSWEFVDYIFLVTECSRAFTHQLVRNRHGSYAQQTMRMLDVSGFTYETGPSIKNNEELENFYQESMKRINTAYDILIKNEAKPEDARGVLPTNIHTNIVCKFNLRTLSEIASKRASSRTQDEYRQFVELFIGEVLKIHPWTHLFLRNRKIEAANKLNDFFSQSNLTENEKIHYTKLIDQLR